MTQVAAKAQWWDAYGRDEGSRVVDVDLPGDDSTKVKLGLGEGFKSQFNAGAIGTAEGIVGAPRVVGRGLQGIGERIQQSGVPGPQKVFGRALESVGKAITPSDTGVIAQQERLLQDFQSRQPMSTEAQETGNFGSLRWWSENTARNLPAMLTMAGGGGAVGRIAGKAAGVATGAALSGTFESKESFDSTVSDLVQKGASQEEAEKQAAPFAIGVGIVNAALDILPLGELIGDTPIANQIKKRMLRGVQKRFAADAIHIGTAGATEATTEAIQDLVQRVGQYGATGDPSVFDEAVPGAIGAGAIGGLMGTSLGTAAHLAGRGQFQTDEAASAHEQMRQTLAEAAQAPAEVAQPATAPATAAPVAAPEAAAAVAPQSAAEVVASRLASEQIQPEPVKPKKGKKAKAAAAPVAHGAPDVAAIDAQIKAKAVEFAGAKGKKAQKLKDEIRALDKQKKAALKAPATVAAAVPTPESFAPELKTKYDRLGELSEKVASPETPLAEFETIAAEMSTLQKEIGALRRSQVAARQPVVAAASPPVEVAKAGAAKPIPLAEEAAPSEPGIEVAPPKGKPIPLRANEKPLKPPKVKGTGKPSAPLPLEKEGVVREQPSGIAVKQVPSEQSFREQAAKKRQKAIEETRNKQAGRKLRPAEVSEATQTKEPTRGKEAKAKTASPILKAKKVKPSKSKPVKSKKPLQGVEEGSGTASTQRQGQSLFEQEGGGIPQSPSLKQYLESGGVHLYSGIPIGPILKKGGSLVASLVSHPWRFVRAGYADMFDVLGAGTDKSIAQLLRKALALQNKFAGELQPERVKAQRTVRANPRGAWALQHVDLNGKTFAIARIVDAVEDTLPPGSKLTRSESNVVNAIRSLMIVTGKLAERVGLTQKDGGGFSRTPGGKVFLRMATQEWIDLMLHATEKQWGQIVTAFSDANPSMGKVKVASVLGKIRDKMRGGKAGGSFRLIGPEIARVFKRAPTHILLDGRVVNLYHTDPFNMAGASVSSMATRLGFIKAFGAKGQVLKELRKQFTDHGGSGEQFDRVGRALAGLPPIANDTVIPARPGTLGYNAARGLGAFISLWKAAKLTGSFAANVFEPVRSALPQYGLRRTAMALWRTTQLTKGSRAVTDALVAANAITNDIVKASLNREHWIADAMKVTGGLLGEISLTRPVNEHQERLAAHLAYILSTDMLRRAKAGLKPSAFDITRMRLLDFSPADAKKLASGQGTKDEYADMIRRSVRFQTGSTKHVAEQSAVESTRIGRFFVWFHRYWANVWRVMAKHGEVIQDASKEGNKKLVWTTSYSLAKHLVGTASAGALTMATMATFYGGLAGLFTLAAGAKDDPEEFLKSSLLSGFTGGLWGFFARAFQDRPMTTTERVGGVVANLGPINTALDFTSLWAGDEGYRNLTGTEKSKAFLARNFPGIRGIPATYAAGLLSVQYRDPEMQASINAYYNWLRKQPGTKSRTIIDQEEAGSKEFHTQLNTAVVRAMRGDDPSKQLIAAIGKTGKTWDDAKSYLRGREFTTALKTSAERQSLHDAVGQRAWDRLILHDRLLRAMQQSPYQVIDRATSTGG